MIRLFCSYAPEDEALCQELEKHLSPLRREGIIQSWHRGRLGAGKDARAEAARRLREADLVLLLLSVDFLHADSLVAGEMRDALRRQSEGRCRVVPLLLRPVQWRRPPLDALQVLPRNERPISLWPDREEAWVLVVEGIAEVIAELEQRPPLPPEESPDRQAGSTGAPDPAPDDTRPPPGLRRRLLLAGAALLLGGGAALSVSLARQAAQKSARAPAGMIYLAGGPFLMGSSEEQLARALAWCNGVAGACRAEVLARERPARDARVSPFFLDATEVTNERFAAWLSARRDLRPAAPDDRVDGSEGPVIHLHPARGGIERRGGAFAARPGLERHPVTQVSWHAAHRFCADQGKRLPTEAQWEFAARGGRSSRFPWGDEDPTCTGVVFGRAAGGPCTHLGAGPAEVGRAAQDRSPQGAFDLAGNVAEWVLDPFYPDYPPCAPPCVDPVAAGLGEPAGLRGIRGGDWAEEAGACRAAGRSRRPAETTLDNVGFRCALLAPPEGRGP